MLKEIENYFCEDITANNKYNLEPIYHLYAMKKKLNTHEKEKFNQYQNN